MEQRGKIALGILSIFAAVFLLYFSSLGLNFLYHDDYVIIKAGLMEPSGYLLGDWVGGRGGGVFYRPLIIISGVLDRILWGLNPFGYHLSNVLFHAAGACVVLLIAVTLTSNFAFALASALLFSVLPMNAEAVNWICCRCDLLATLFYLLAFYAYLIYSSSKKKWILAASALSFLFSLASKESALTLPIMIALYEYLRGDKKASLRSFMGYASILVPYFIVRYISLGTFIGGYRISPMESVINILIGPLKTFQLVFLPFIQDNILLYLILLPLVIAATGILAIIYIRRFRPAAAFYFFLLWILIGILPALNFLSTGFDLRGSRWWYFSSAGVAWALAYPVFVDAEKFNVKLRAVLKLIFVLFFIYSSFYLLRINREWVAASDMTKKIRADAVAVIEKQPKERAVFFWNMPDNHKGCYVGMPFLEEPFYKTDRKARIWGYQPGYSYIGEFSNAQLSNGAHYIYNFKTGRFDRSTPAYIRKDNIPRLRDPMTNKERFREFLNGIKKNAR